MRAALRQLTLLLAFASSFGSQLRDASAQTPEAAKSVIEQRIRHVTNRLLVETAVDGVFGSGTLQERMAYYHTPGVSVAVVNNFAIEWARGFGVQEAGGHRRITTATRFQAASVSKPTFAVAVMRLVERGDISLDEDVNNYLTSWKVPAVGDWHPRITLRELFGHSAGFTVDGFLGYAQSQRVPTLVQVLDGLPPANSPPVRMDMLPGMQYRYSGGGVSIAQLAVEDRTGRKLPALARELIFDRLDMRRSGYDQPLRDTNDVATGHYWMARPLSGHWHTYPELAAAGLWTTPSDLAKLGISLQRALRGDVDQVLTPQAAREMVTRQPIRGDKIGISFFLAGESDSARFEHTGSNEGFLTEFVMYVRGGWGAVVMMNSSEGFALTAEITRAIAREYGWPDFLGVPPQSTEVAADVRQRRAGNYLLEDGTKIVIEDRSRAMWLNVPNQPPLRLAALSDASFVILDLKTKVTFPQPDAEPMTFVLEQDGQSFKATRQAPGL